MRAEMVAARVDHPGVGPERKERTRLSSALVPPPPPKGAARSLSPVGFVDDDMVGGVP